ncbi:PREDICTED: germin-like protein subfamily 2 member 3 [Camelina sativa]|uniref:Germin-like protein n=1 Tax=Camelina sativa TaxID=90675 RepID=A0ABM0W0Y1_CAMSA|nr:PREDICTED: germin-like protein subfamily 2 member 3 [Camelina sativa]
MATSMIHLFVTVMLVAAHTAFAETMMLQDFCVADLANGVKVNGYPCKDPTKVTPEDFYFAGLANAAATANSTMGSAVTGANVEKVPGLNTLGVSISRIDYAPGGINPPHLHPRASEAIFVLEGRLFVGFLTTTGKLISKYVNKGDVFVFPKALLHFQQNPNNTPASVIAAFDSQLPGTQVVGPSLFGANPPIPDELLTKAFGGLAAPEIQKLKGKFPPKK